MKEYGKSDQILTDRGCQFYPARGGVSEFTKFCSEKGIEHIVASVRRPYTIGKIEAFYKAYLYEDWTFPTHEVRASTSGNQLSLSGRRIVQEQMWGVNSRPNMAKGFYRVRSVFFTKETRVDAK